jgi:hypothetical protein
MKENLLIMYQVKTNVCVETHRKHTNKKCLKTAGS